MTERSPFARAVAAALDEARRRGDRRMGTEHLLLGLLHDPASAPARALGVDLATARAALDALDRDALQAIGIGTDAAPDGPAGLPRRHPPVPASALTSGGRAVVRRAVDATTARTRHTGPRHLLLALLERGHPDPVAALVDRLGVDRAAVRGRVVDAG
jgi:ATP-dependent Clp protease ATP-binding subunit ClpA